jgi:hypothetical protein
MKNNKDLEQHLLSDSSAESRITEKAIEPVASVLPTLNRLIEDWRTGYRSGSRLDVQFDYAQGRMAISH